MSRPVSILFQILRGRPTMRMLARFPSPVKGPAFVMVGIAVALLATGSWAASSDGGKKVFEIRGLDIERYVPEYVHAMIEKGAVHDINAIGFSHHICMNVEEILYDWHRYQILESFCRHAHERGMKVYLWTHELNGCFDRWMVSTDDGRRLNADDPALYEWIADKYRRACEKVPSADGFILSLTESALQVHRDNRVISKKTPAERMARVINAVREGCAAHGKRLMARDFLRNPAEMEAFVQALKMVSDDVWVYTKCVPNDWEFKYPPHPLLGKVAPHKQIMEMDLATEVGGITRWPMCIPEYIQANIRLARDKGLAGVIPRCDDGFGSNVGTPNEINVYAYLILINDPDADVNKIWRDFCVKRYGAKGAPAAERVLRRSFDIACKLQYTLGFWTGKGSAPPTVAYTDGHLIYNSTAIWDPSPKNKRIEKMLLDSGPETIEAVVAEKAQAEELSRQCLAEIEDAKDLLSRKHYYELRGCYRRTLRDATTGKVWARAYFAMRWYRNTGAAEARAEMDRALGDCGAYVREMAAADKKWDASGMNRFIGELETEREKVSKR